MTNRIFLIILFSIIGCTLLPAQEQGMASYYSNRLHGRRMSDGTRYHRDSLTCAHKRYPLGTLLKVTNPKNGKSVVVKVTDRCGSRRIIDLSYAAAKQIGIISSGVAMVKVEKYTPEQGVPFRLDRIVDVPELDFEVTESNEDGTPIWMKSGDKLDIKHANRPPAKGRNNSGERKKRK